MKQLIHENMSRCAQQRRLDSGLALVSLLVINVLLFYFYGQNLIILIPFLAAAWIVHVVVMTYCHRLWTLRIRKWQAFARWYGLMASVEELFILSDELRSSLARSADTAAERLLSPPILS